MCVCVCVYVCVCVCMCVGIIQYKKLKSFVKIRSFLFCIGRGRYKRLHFSKVLFRKFSAANSSIIVSEYLYWVAQKSSTISKIE